ncbi:MAG TPA: radical SAM protein [Vicinamibacteria bacterium]|nr:radical SAM protein [Vicinamibacteria bacterium]
MNVLTRVSQLVHRAFLPLLIFYPTSRCNSRCVSCDWWKSTGADDMTLDEIATMAQSLGTLGTRVVLFSGGEPLVRPDLFEIAALFQSQHVRLELLTSGVLLPRHAREVADLFSRVTISLDATSRDAYRSVRGLDALAAVEAGVDRLRRLAPGLPVTARSTLHKRNFRELPRLVEKARTMELHSISFLAADVSTLAFGRQHLPAADELLLDSSEVEEMRAIVEDIIENETEAFWSGRIAESPDRLRRIPAYYAALLGEEPFPRVSCNAPWISAVVEANGNVRPCFFHAVIGSLRERPLTEILSEDLPAFRSELDVERNSLCQRCVCSIRVGPRSPLWH